MKAMILAAGRGERLRPLTDTTPKPLIEVDDKPLITWHIENLHAAGIDDIVINTAWLGEQIRDTLGDGSALGVSIRYSDEGDTALETAGGIIKALPLLGDDPFLVVNGDIWCDFDFRHWQSRLPDALAHLLLVKNPQHNPSGDFSLDGDLLSNNVDETYTFSGIGMYRPELFEQFDGGVVPLGPILRSGADEGLISAEVHAGRWTDVGTVDRLEQLRAELGT